MRRSEIIGTTPIGFPTQSRWLEPSKPSVTLRRLGKLYRRTDKREQAQEHLTTATTMYREMRMTYWLEKAESETSRKP